MSLGNHEAAQKAYYLGVFNHFTYTQLIIFP